MNRRQFLATGAAAAAAPFLNGQAAKPRNVLFIASDDLNASLGCYGHPLVKTPNLDRLAKQGVRFDRAYCQFPLCGPSRASLMTGTGSDYTGVWGNGTDFRKNIPAAVTLGNLFQKNGYFSARSGKIYHYGVPTQIGTPGLDDASTWNVALNPAGVDHTQEEPKITNYTPDRGIGTAVCFYASPAKDEEHTDAMTAANIIDLMEKHRNEPFFLAAGMYRPHVPWMAPTKYYDMYPLKDIELVRYDEGEMKIAPELAYFTNPANWNMTKPQMKEALRAYYASISFMDAQVGKLLAALERLKLENTAVVFWSDHGYALGDHGQWMKQTLFERTARVPMIMGGAGVAARGKSSRRTVELVDIYPTLVDLCGLKGAPSYLHGKSLAPLLKDPDAAWDKPAVTQVARGGGGGEGERVKKAGGKRKMGYTIRNERYRYTMWENGTEGEELYDYETDIREVKNRAQDPSLASMRAQMRKQLETIIAQRRRV